MNAALAQLPALAVSHLALAAAALLLALGVAVPLGLAAARRPRLARIALGMAGIVQTIPGLALLALFYPLLLALSTLVGARMPALGFLPSLLALALYAVLPILRNLVAGLQGIAPGLIEAANGIGMTPSQRLRLVELPLAAPIAMAGLRTATVWTIGAATLSTTVGYPSLGNLIFSGLQTETWPLVLTGCIAAAVLALAADGLLALVERGLATRRRGLVIGPGAIVLVLLGAALAWAAWPAPPVVTIGAKTFSEQYILARVIGRRLEQAGYRVRYREGLGSAVALRALEAGEIDAYVDYSGTLWSNAMGRQPPVDRAAITRWLAARSGVRVIGPLGFENAYALAVRGDAPFRSLQDLAGAAPRLTLAADLEFLDRPEWAALREAYGLRFAATRAYAPTFMYRALSGGQADAIAAFSSDGRIAADGLRVLADPRHALPAYEALLMVAPTRARDERFVRALTPLVGAIPVERMRAANLMVDRDRDKRTPDEAAAWLDPR
ncbi:ABC transporter permease/substrate-binding protein [Sphingomonas jatrophae]|uniref:Osmoprotectant transport system permease protein n=1 Tax=Sphingomonas jatrophae TaxID=1166337 RepID=A0A1I6LE02_9SPHN|nr:glycine betaine ABC transporter substrate-binding protein [Sphingomonas jatrophae]SFS01741.1 osmoprotectant transport system permease protein [Sphingomonas jatrophae]